MTVQFEALPGHRGREFVDVVTGSPLGGIPTGRWVTIPITGEEVTNPAAFHQWEAAMDQPDRLWLSATDEDARMFTWEWVPYEADEIPVPWGTDHYGNPDPRVNWRTVE